MRDRASQVDVVSLAMVVVAMVLIATVATPCWAEDSPAIGSAEAGAQRIRTAGCVVCHGRDGVSKLAEAPNLAGQVQAYLATSLQAYRSGARQNELMSTVAAKLSDEDIGNLSAYYASIKVTVTPPAKP